jgi:glycosyltransferase involved in cell wall biosynthesis
MPTLKVLILAHSFPQNDNDYRGRFILDFVKSQKSTEFHIIAPHYKGSFDKEIDGAMVHYFEWKHGYLAGRKLYNPVTLFVTIKLIAMFFLNAKKILKEEKFDHIFACWALPAGFVAYLLKKFMKIKYKVWLLGTDVNKFINIPFFLSAILKNAGEVFANSEELKGKIVVKFRSLEVEILPTRSTLPEPVRPENPHLIDKEKFNVFFVGRLEEVKGIDIFIEIAKKVKEQMKNTEFFVIGDGSMAKIVEPAHNDNEIIWLGKLTQGEISHYSEFMNLLLITSRSESMPVVFWELHEKVKILSFPVGDIPKYLQKENLCETVEEFVEEITNRVR